MLTLADAHIHAPSLNLFSVFSLVDSVPKVTFKIKRLMFQNNTNTHRNTRTHPRTSTHRTYKNWRRRKRSLLCRKLRIAQLQILTISHHVIAVSAQQREGRKMYTKARWIRGRSVFNYFVVFFLAIYSCSLLIPLLLNRINVVVNGHDDIEMSTIGPANYTTRAIRPSASDWNSNRLSYWTSVAREETSDSIQVIEAAAEITLQGHYSQLSDVIC